MLRELSKGEVEPSLLLAMRTLNSSLVGVRHILKGNILMMRGLDNTSGLCEAAQVRRVHPKATFLCFKMSDMLMGLCDRSPAGQLSHLPH